MERRIKLIWDFKGPDALKTAEHHCIHLKEFTQIDKLPYHEVNLATLNEMHSVAYITIDESLMKVFRDALKPHRGELAD